MQELIGTTIDHYQIERHLTRGGMSEIYLALDTQTQTTVAIKLVHSSNIDYCKRFKHEVKTVSSLQHDHILPAFSYGDYKDWCYMVTPYVEYGTLNRKLADGPLSFEEAGNMITVLSTVTSNLQTSCYKTVSMFTLQILAWSNGWETTTDSP